MLKIHSLFILVLLLPVGIQAREYRLADNTWQTIKTKKSPSFGIDAYSGMAYDPKSHQLFFFGGGHNDYVQNDLWIFNIDKAEWYLGYKADTNPMDQLDCKSCFSKKYPGAHFPKGIQNPQSMRPLARHTYSSPSVVIDAAGNSHFIFSGSYGPAAGDPIIPFKVSGDVWSFTVETKKWSYRRRNPGNGETAMVFVPAGKKNGGTLYSISKNDPAGVPDLNRYDFDRDQWKEVRSANKVHGISHREHIAVYVNSENAIYVFSGANHFEEKTNELWKLDLNRMRWSKAKTRGQAPPKGVGQGLAYDEKNKVLISLYTRRDKVELYAYPLDTQTWTKVAPSGKVPILKGDRLMYTRFLYVPKENLFFLVAAPGDDYTIRTWVYRYKN